jgi:hypothetical protein
MGIVLVGLVVYFGLSANIGWLLPVATAVSGWLGYKASKDASKQQTEAQNAQLNFEQQQAARMTEQQKQQMDLANAMAFGGEYNVGEGAQAKKMTFPGAAGQADDWTQKYLNWLQTSPDLEYNQQRGRMERDFAQGLDAAGARINQAGGVTSGYAQRGLRDLSVARAGMLGGMEAGRSERMGQRLSAGSQLAQGLYDRALNMRQSAMGMPAPASTMVPQMMSQNAGRSADQATALAGATGSLFNLWLQQQQRAPQVMQAPVQPASPIGTNWQNQFQDFRLKGGQGWRS